MRHAQSCSWYCCGKLAEISPLDFEGEGGEMSWTEGAEGPVDDEGGDEMALQMQELEELPEEIMDDFMEYDDLFHFVPLSSTPPPMPEIGEAGLGPSSSAAMDARCLQHRVLDDEDDSRVEDVYEGAGRVVRMNQTLHEKWKRQFASEFDGDGDAAMDDGTAPTSNTFYPFASEMDWRVANWMIKESPGNKAFDRLLEIPGVCIY